MVELVLLFCLALAALRTGVKLHAFVAMSNHVHIVLTDVEGRLPEFMHTFCRLSACLLNHYYDRQECLWSPGSYSAVHLVEAEDVLRFMAYLFANPTAAGLTARGAEWPGVISHPDDLLEGDGIERRKWVKRPQFYFGKESNVPAALWLEFSCPPSLADRPRREVVADLLARREAREAEARRKREAVGRRFLGVKGVLATSPFDRARSKEGRRRLSPTVACQNREKRIEVLRERRRFMARYRLCFELFRRGMRQVVFPAGTYGPVRFCGVRAAPIDRDRAA